MLGWLDNYISELEGQQLYLMFTWNITMLEISLSDLSDFDRGMVVGTRSAGLSISKTTYLRFSCSLQRLHRMVQNTKNIQWAALLVTGQINTLYKSGEEKDISEYTTHQTVRISYDSGRHHQGPIPSLKYRNLRLQWYRFTQTGQLKYH